LIGCRGGGLGRQGRDGVAGRGNHRNPPANVLRRQRQQAVGLEPSKAKFDRDGAALDIAFIVQALPKRGY
jgi:hypothetical protein